MASTTDGKGWIDQVQSLPSCHRHTHDTVLQTDMEASQRF